MGVEQRLFLLFTLFNWLNSWALYMPLSLISSVALYPTLTNNHLLSRLNSLCISSPVMVCLKASGFACWDSPTGCCTLTSRADMQSLELLRWQAQAITKSQSGLLWKKLRSLLRNTSWDIPKSFSEL